MRAKDAKFLIFSSTGFLAKSGGRSRRKASVAMEIVHVTAQPAKYSTDVDQRFTLPTREAGVHTNGSKLPTKNRKVGNRDERKNGQSTGVSSDVDMRLSKRKKRKSQRGLVEATNGHTSNQ